MTTDEIRYDIIFTGKLVDGVNSDQAKMALAQLFKTSVLKVNKLFNGKPQFIKRNITKPDAIKYKSALHQAGLLVAFKAHQAPEKITDNAASKQEIPQQQPTTSSLPEKQAALTVAPAGESVLSENERSSFVAADIDTSAIKLSSPFSDVTPLEKPTPSAPDTSHISVAELGTDLIEEPEYPLPPLPLDLDSYSIAPFGETLETLDDKSPPLNPDISHISLAQAGEDLLPDKQEKASPAPPNTSHISLSTPDK